MYYVMGYVQYCYTIKAYHGTATESKRNFPEQDNKVYRVDLCPVDG